MTIDVSIVIPTFRRPTTLVEAINSVLAQQGITMEVLVIDDCPSGSAEDAVRGIPDPRLRYMRNPTPSNGRPAAVRNVGWPLTNGEFIHFMDDDDLLPEGIYADAVATFRRSPNIGLVFGDIVPFGEPSQSLDGDRALFAKTSRRAARLQRWGSRWPFASYLLFSELLFNGGSALMRRRCIEAVGGCRLNLEIMEDLDFLVRLTRRFGVKYLNRVSLYYRIWPSLMHRSTNVNELMHRSYRRMHADYRADFGSLDFYALKIAARSILRFV
jgi:glycosyltransferase involved in cell wall biosynthesis